MIPSALNLILKFEGGYVNDPQDPGGATNYGITQRTYSDYLKAKNFPNNSVATITIAEASQIYQNMYWAPAYCDQIYIINSNLATAHFDNAVNCGVTTANKMLQGVVGVAQDGIFGPSTLNAITNYPNVLGKYLARRLDYYLKIVADRPSMAKFLASWVSRVQQIMKLSYI